MCNFTCVCEYMPEEARRMHQLPGPEVTCGVELPDAGAGHRTGSVEEQQVHLVIKPSVSPALMYGFLIEHIKQFLLVPLWCSGVQRWSGKSGFLVLPLEPASRTCLPIDGSEWARHFPVGLWKLVLCIATLTPG